MLIYDFIRIPREFPYVSYSRQGKLSFSSEKADIEHVPGKQGTNTQAISIVFLYKYMESNSLGEATAIEVSSRRTRANARKFRTRAARSSIKAWELTELGIGLTTLRVSYIKTSTA